MKGESGERGDDRTALERDGSHPSICHQASERKPHLGVQCDDAATVSMLSAERAPAVPKHSLADLAVAPGHLLRRARQFHDALWLQQVGETVTPLQFAVLTALEAEPELNQRELGERVALDKSTIGDLVARLMRRGYVRRRPDPRDGRRRILLITPAGREVLFATRPSIVNIGQQILEPLESDERNELIRLLAKIVFSDRAGHARVGKAGRREVPGIPSPNDRPDEESQ